MRLRYDFGNFTFCVTGNMGQHIEHHVLPKYACSAVERSGSSEEVYSFGSGWGMLGETKDSPKLLCTGGGLI